MYLSVIIVLLCLFSIMFVLFHCVAYYYKCVKHTKKIKKLHDVIFKKNNTIEIIV